MHANDDFDSDARLARRLQAQEIYGQHVVDVSEPNAVEPLIAGNNIPNAARAVQDNVRAQFEDASERSPRLFALYLCLCIAEITASSIILALNWHKSCDKPLLTWVLGFTGRFAIMIPITTYRFFYHDNNNNNNNHVALIRSLGSWVSLYTFVWFIIGQVWTFGSDTCHDTAPSLYTYALVLIIFMYFSLLLPVILVLMLCLCMPCVFLVMRFFAGSRGASQDVVARIPVIQYRADAQQERADQSSSSCAICMNDYEENDELRVLPCKHLFHKACVDNWLVAQRTCPYCRHDVTT